MDELFIYVDEAGNPNLKNYKGGENERYFQVGAAVFLEEVPKNVIEEAMSELKKVDPLKLTNSDKKAIERGYFHASFDGPNAKSKLMEQTNKFQFEFYHYKYDKQLHNNLGRDYVSEKNLHFHLIHLASVIGLNYPVSKINLVVAVREKSFPQGSEKMWKDSFYLELINSAASNPAIKTPFPEFNVTIVNGENPGVQIADLLLWAMTRKDRLISPQTDWYNRIQTKTAAKITIPNDPLIMNDFNVNTGLSIDNKEEIFYHIKPSEIDSFENTHDKNRFISLLMWMEDSVLSNVNKNQIGYLKEYLQNAMRIIASQKDLTTEEVRQICQAYLVIFDTLKIYKNAENEEELKLALLAKRYASIIIEGKEVRWFFMAKDWGGNHKRFVTIRNQ